MSTVPIPKLRRAAAAFQPDAGGGAFSREMMRFRFEPWAIEKRADRKRKYHAGFNPCFPLMLNLFSYEASPTFPVDWHEHLEIFVPCAGSGKFVMADRVAPFPPATYWWSIISSCTEFCNSKGQRAAVW